MPSTILSDNGVSSGTAGIKTTGSNDGQLALQTTTAGGTATTAMTIDTSQNVGVGGTPAASLSIFKTSTALSGTGNSYGVYLYPTSSGQCWLDAITSSSGNTSMGLRSYNNGTYYTANLDNSGNFQFNSGYGSTATAYGCRSWVNFNGTGTVAIRASGNVSSITDNGTGQYTVNFASSLVDASYAVSATTCIEGGEQDMRSAAVNLNGSQNASACAIKTMVSGTTNTDRTQIYVAFFR